MMKFVAIIAFFAVPFVSFSQNKSVSALHKKYKDDNVFTVKSKCLQILAVSKDAKGYTPRDIKRLKKQIGREAFEELFSVKSNGGQLQLLTKNHNGKGDELVMIINKDSEGFITLDFSGADFD